MDRDQAERLRRRALQSISNMTPGTMITHLQMEQLVGFGRKEDPQRYYQFVNAIRGDLKRDHGVWLRVQQKIGYEIVLHGEEIEQCTGSFMTGIKRMKRAITDTQLIRLDLITDSEQRTKTVERSQQMGNLIGLMGQQMRIIEA